MKEYGTPWCIISNCDVTKMTEKTQFLRLTSVNTTFQRRTYFEYLSDVHFLPLPVLRRSKQNYPLLRESTTTRIPYSYTLNVDSRSIGKNNK